METYTQRIRREGREEGRREAEAELVVRAVRDAGIPLDKIADLLSISVDDARSYALDAGLSVD